jgi:peptidoglycan/xylan/chitin deacetylase (PgdA/CDA1 family)
MRWLRQSSQPIVELTTVVEAALGKGSVPEGAVAVTFDDGYADFYDVALPILQEQRIPATLFAVAGKLGGWNDWMPEGADRRPLMTGDQLQQLPEWGITVGSHSLTHARLPELDDEALARELQDSRARLADVLGQDVDLLAYPHGLYDERVMAFAHKAGYRGACSTRSGFNADGVEPLALRRIDVYGTDVLGDFRRKLAFGVNKATRTDQLRYYWRQLRNRLTGSYSF